MGRTLGGAKDTLTSVYDLIFRSYYDKERSEAIKRGLNPEELLEVPEIMREVLYYLDRAKKHEADE